MPQAAFPQIAFHCEHIIAKRHRGSDAEENLALACPRCNVNKMSDLSGIDPADGAIVPLFNPRTDTWEKHFSNEGGAIIGLTACGRATVATLRMNEPKQIELRQV